jgi:cell shape-determining protein MreC
LLILASLAMITVYFRESPDGGLHGFQSAGASAMRPFEIAANRIARPFEDAYNWTADLFHARAENKQLREQLSQARQDAIGKASAVQELEKLRRILDYQRGPTYPEDFPNAVTASVISNPASQFDQTVVISAGRTSGIRVYDAVVTAGLQQGKLPSFYPKGIPIGLVTKVGQTDIDPFQNVQVMPLVDFSSLEVVVVLVSDKPRPKMP